MTIFYRLFMLWIWIMLCWSFKKAYCFYILTMHDSTIRKQPSYEFPHACAAKEGKESVIDYNRSLMAITLAFHSGWLSDRQLPDESYSNFKIAYFGKAMAQKCRLQLTKDFDEMGCVPPSYVQTNIKALLRFLTRGVYFIWKYLISPKVQTFTFFHQYNNIRLVVCDASMTLSIKRDLWVHTRMPNLFSYFICFIEAIYFMIWKCMFTYPKLLCSVRWTCKQFEVSNETN